MQLFVKNVEPLNLRSMPVFLPALSLILTCDAAVPNARLPDIALLKPEAAKGSPKPLEVFRAFLLAIKTEAAFFPSITGAWNWRLGSGTSKSSTAMFWPHVTFRRCPFPAQLDATTEEEQDDRIRDFYLLRQAPDVDELERVLEHLHPMSGKEYSMAIGAFVRLKDMNRAAQLFLEWRSSGLPPDILPFNAAISACEKAGDWQFAFQLLDEIRDWNLSPDVVSYTGATWSCTKGDQVPRALQLLDEKTEAFAADVDENRSYNVALSAWEPTTPQGTSFGVDWFSQHIPLWQIYLQPFVHVPKCHALEVGCWEGRATCWLMKNVLTHPTCTITAIDTFVGSVEHQESDHAQSLQGLEARFRGNIEAIGCTDRVVVMPMTSDAALGELLVRQPQPQFDVVYIDGSHWAKDVLSDAVLAFKMLKKGGIMIFDDYGWTDLGDDPQASPKAGIDAFLQGHEGLVEVLHIGFQVVVERI